jgi:hypothetical protein
MDPGRVLMGATGIELDRNDIQRENEVPSRLSAAPPPDCINQKVRARGAKFRRDGLLLALYVGNLTQPFS